MNKNDLIAELENERLWFSQMWACALSGKCQVEDLHQFEIRKTGEIIKQLEEKFKEIE